MQKFLLANMPERSLPDGANNKKSTLEGLGPHITDFTPTDVEVGSTLPLPDVQTQLLHRTTLSGINTS